MNNNNENTTSQGECKFLVTEIVQGIIHNFCQNAEMHKINNIQSGKELFCMGIRCGKASFHISETA